MVKKIKISFLWVKTIVDVFDSNKSKNSDYKLKDSYNLTGLIESLNNNAVEQNYFFPWKISLEKNNFWNYYLQGKSQIDTCMIEDYIVPLFYRIKASINFELKDIGKIKITPETYLYRHGIGLILNINIPENERGYSFDEISEIVYALFYTKKYSFKSDDIGEYIDISLAELSNYIFGYIEDKIIKIKASTFLDSHPFSIMTIFKSDSESLIKDENENVKVEKIFKILNQHYMGRIPIKDYSESQQKLMFSAPKSRILWYPEQLLIRPKRNTVSCYHKNLLKLTLQIESLADLLDKYILSEKYDLEGLNRYVKKAQVQLVRLYSAKTKGKNSSYRSASSVAQINQNDYIDLIKEVRKKRNIQGEVNNIVLEEL